VNTPHLRTPHSKALLLLWVMIALYITNFGVLAVLQNAAFETGAADLGNMNQAAWYTLHKGFPADSFAGEVITRLGGHVEPIFYLLAIPYAAQQTADMLLVLQTVIVALGALAAYMLARDVLGMESAGLAFALVYLLFPSLQAATLTEFHPVALAAPFFLFAFYYMQKGNNGAFLVFALLAMSVKEDMSLLVVMLGLWALVLTAKDAEKSSSKPARALRLSGILAHNRRGAAALVAILAGLGWFVLTVYVIIPHFSASGSNVLFERYSEVGGSPQGLLRTLLSNPLAVAARVFAPEKLSYLVGLLVSAGLLTLAAPWALLLAAPSLGINMLSNYQPMYSGLSHYSAPVAPFIIIGAIYVARTASRWLQRGLLLPARRSLVLVLAWLLAVVTVYQAFVGFTPLSMLYRVPRVTAHHRLVTRFVQQIPPDAIVSAQIPLHPHVSSRALIYPFPTVADAEYVLLDVTARPTMHPNDLKSSIERLLSSDGFGVLDAADGYVLLKRGAAQNTLPESFYTAFRVALPRPQYRVVADFSPSLRLLGYDIEDVDEGRQPWTRLRLYWQVHGALPDDLHIYPFYLDSAGGVIEDTAQRPLVGPLWYPPARWQPGDTLRIETLPWPVGSEFRVALGVARGGDWSNRAARLPVSLQETTNPVYVLDGGTALEIGRFRRVITTLTPAKRPAPQLATRTDIGFGDAIKLIGYDVQGTVQAGSTVRLTLYWQALARPSADYHTFVHVYVNNGRVAAQDDGVTGDSQPATWWLPGQIISETRTVNIPAGANVDPAIAIGLYQFETNARLPVTGNGKPLGDTLRIQP
jgi:uncharacterized membrane protein